MCSKLRLCTWCLLSMVCVQQAEVVYVVCDAGVTKLCCAVGEVDGYTKFHLCAQPEYSSILETVVHSIHQ